MKVLSIWVTIVTLGILYSAVARGQGSVILPATPESRGLLKTVNVQIEAHPIGNKEKLWNASNIYSGSGREFFSPEFQRTLSSVKINASPWDYFAFALGPVGVYVMGNVNYNMFGEVKHGVVYQSRKPGLAGIILPILK